MRLSHFSIAFSFALAFPCLAQETKGANCALETPPPAAGETFFATEKTTVAGRVYPRLSDLPERYTGCQILWSSVNGGRVMRSTTYFTDGRVVAVDPVPEGIALCKPGEKVADSGCTSRKDVVIVSFPPGCAARTLQDNAIPKDCMAAFHAEFKLHDRLTD